MRFASTGRSPALLLGFGFPTSAVAEVCDKKRPSWDPSSGENVLVTELVHGAGIIVAAMALSFVMLRWHSMPWWIRLTITIVGTAWFGLIAFAAASDEMVSRHYIWQAAVKEGCVSGYPTGTFANVVALIICLSTAFLLLRARKAGE